ncbi:jg12185 [Pararge aegeria aegeria]|uniref:Jg12185 protein n=1 Tax=Pararge aegeria aegeria TaxID=348720 RepID=A0A8S4RCL8_9NEOP|nr:jg12185 [Pararge aegeria aegeria]
MTERGNDQSGVERQKSRARSNGASTLVPVKRGKRPHRVDETYSQSRDANISEANVCPPLHRMTVTQMVRQRSQFRERATARLTHRLEAEGCAVTHQPPRCSVLSCSGIVDWMLPCAMHEEDRVGMSTLESRQWAQRAGDGGGGDRDSASVARTSLPGNKYLACRHAAGSSPCPVKTLAPATS